MRSALACVAVAVSAGAACGRTEAAAPAARCTGERPPPSIRASSALPTGTAGGENAWFEAQVTRVETVVADNQILLDGAPVPIVRVKPTKPDAEGAVIDPTAGRLKPSHPHAASDAPDDYPYLVGFRVPPRTPPGKRQLVFKTCGVAARESIAIEVLPSAAPVIHSIHLARGEQWPALFIKGSHLSDAEEVLLVDEDAVVSTLPNITRIDDAQIRAPLDRPGTYEVFVRTKSGLGGGPPNGVVTVR